MPEINDTNPVATNETQVLRDEGEQVVPGSSPAISPPISQTPGPRATRLKQVFDQALGRTLRANSYANFAGCFPTPARHVPSSLESVWRQLNAKLEESAKAEFGDIVRERDLVGLLNELDRLVGEARFRRENGNNGGGKESGDGDGDGTGVVTYVYPFFSCEILL